ncbi:RNA polymerase sigma-70 factor [Carboxylicivirga sp. N1Y90]|uniref:RNA polymerase sigma-70 factor n=1 Tax=Carboxylicivirga fragile TaxID=3417571 RepID=UPI003D33FECD|nr:RNA polymerase sigma-70 factor [Marinilabiliaceae bacterium N1Y90]
MQTKVDIDIAKDFLAKRDIKSFKVIYDRYFKGLCFFAGQYLSNEQSVEDYVQEVFVYLWENEVNISNPTKLSGYLYASVRNKCLNCLRKEEQYAQYKSSLDNIDEWEEDESLRLIKAEVYAEIMQSIEKLPKRAREVFKLSYLTQLRESEIAERLSISENTVKTHKKRAKMLLKEELKHLFSLILILKI